MIPVGAPAEIAAGHPTPPVLSDVLGGALPAGLFLPNGQYAMWVRESAATEGLDRNVLAGVACVVFGGRYVPVLGPAALTTTDWLPSGVGVAECFTEVAAPVMRDLLHDLQSALDGVDHGFSQPALERDGWPDKIRAVGSTVSVLPISDEWPYPAGGPPRRDPVSAALRRAGFGQEFVPFPVGTF
jgi:hypothetical protein